MVKKTSFPCCAKVCRFFRSDERSKYKQKYNNIYIICVYRRGLHSKSNTTWLTCGAYVLTCSICLMSVFHLPPVMSNNSVQMRLAVSLAQAVHASISLLLLWGDSSTFITDEWSDVSWCKGVVTFWWICSIPPVPLFSRRHAVGQPSSELGMRPKFTRSARSLKGSWKDVQKLNYSFHQTYSTALTSYTVCCVWLQSQQNVCFINYHVNVYVAFMQMLQLLPFVLQSLNYNLHLSVVSLMYSAAVWHTIDLQVSVKSLYCIWVPFTSMHMWCLGMYQIWKSEVPNAWTVEERWCITFINTNKKLLHTVITYSSMAFTCI